MAAISETITGGRQERSVRSNCVHKVSSAMITMVPKPPFAFRFPYGHLSKSNSFLNGRRRRGDSVSFTYGKPRKRYCRPLVPPELEGEAVDFTWGPVAQGSQESLSGINRSIRDFY